jgi:GntR family transcriptional regulator
MMNNSIFDSIRIDRRSATPIHQQISNELQSLIASKKLNHESTLPSIKEFARNLKVTPTDVRLAFDNLNSLNYIIALDNGTFRVTFFDLHSDLKKPFYIIIDQIIAMGMNVSIVLLEKKIFYPSIEESRLYGFLESEKLLYLKRMYYGDQRAFFMGEHVIPLSIFPIFEHIVMGHERLYPLMVEYGKVEMKHAIRLAEARIMDQTLAHLFSLKTGSAYLQVNSKMYDQYQRQIEFSAISLIANYSIELTVSRFKLFSPK